VSDVFKINVKFYTEGDLDTHEIVPVFHTWIQNQSVPDHTLIDVSDYGHVHNGPGTLLVAHEANFYADKLDGRLGFTYSRKQPADGDFANRLKQAFGAALEGCARLEDEPALQGRVKFRTGEASIKLNDRLYAPNTPETFAKVRPDLERVASEIYGGPSVELEHFYSELTLFEVRLTASDSPDIATMLSRLGRSPAPSR
jgi:hypothetical protein